MFPVLTSLKFTATSFWIVNALWVYWQFMRVLSFWFWSWCFWNMSFFVFILDAIFCGTNFFIFQNSVWIVKKSWCVHRCSNPQFYWFSDRCRSGFALWWFFVRKKLSSQIGSFHKLLVLATECFLFWHPSNLQRHLFELLMRCGFADSSWEY